MRMFTKSDPPGGIPRAPGKLNLRISGFSHQQIVPIAQIVQAVDVLPSFHVEGLREIVYTPEALIANPRDVYAARPWGIRKGEFRQKERKIFFYDFDGPDLFHQILYHEIGHFVFFLVIGSRVKKRWVTQIFPRSECITAYASLNASEDFAETYACYVRDPESLKKLPEKYAFMRDSVFSGKPGTLKEKG
jgi:hypothetical protein